MREAWRFAPSVPSSPRPTEGTALAGRTIAQGKGLMLMSRRAITAVVIAVALVLGAVYAIAVTTRGGSELLFDSASWVVFLSPFVGVFAAGITGRQDPRIEGERVLRHDGAALLEHWTHGVGTLLLLLTGIPLGLLFIPALVPSGTGVWGLMNLHFVAVVMFLFGTFYYAANTLISWARFREHLPTRHAFSYTVQHYGHLLGVKGYEMPAEDKYLESEKVAYLLALAATSVVVLTGLVKVASHIVNVPGAVAGTATLLHDIATVGMLIFFVAHVFFAAVLPMSWPVLKSMFTGYVTKEHAQKDHAGWYAQLTDNDASK